MITLVIDLTPGVVLAATCALVLVLALVCAGMVALRWHRSPPSSGE